MKNRAALILLAITALLTMHSIAYSSDWKNAMQNSEKALEAGNYASAFDLAKESLKYAETEFGKKSEYYAQSLSRAGAAKLLAGQYNDAIEYFLKTKDLYAELFGREDIRYATALNNLSVANQSMGNYRLAEKYLVEAVDIKESSGTEDLSLAKSYNNLAQLYQEIGNYSEAEPLYLKSLEIKERISGRDDESFAKTLMNAAILYKSLSNYEKAAEMLEESSKTLAKHLGETNPDAAKSIFQLGMVYQALGQNDKALPILEKAQKIREEQVGSGHPDYAETLYNIAMLKWETGNVEESLQLLEEAAEMIEQKVGNGHPLYSACMNSLGVINWIEGDMNKASEYLQKAVYLRKMTYGENHQKYATSLNNYAGFLKDAGQFQKAEENYTKAFDIYLSLIRDQFKFMSESEKANFYGNFKDRFEMFNCYVITRKDENPTLISQMYNYRLSTKAILLSSTKKLRQTILNSGNEELIGKFDKWRALKEKLIEVYSMSKQERQMEKIDLNSIEKNINDLEKELSRESKAFGDEIDTDTVTWEDIRDALKPGEAAVEVVRFRFFERGWQNKIFYAFIIVTPETKSHPVMVLFQNGEQLENDFYKYYSKSLQFRIDDDESYGRFWKEIDEKLGNAKTVYFSPDGIYNKININGLKISDGKYVIDEKYISNLTNTSEIALSERDSGEEFNNDIVIGYPAYNEMPAGISNKHTTAIYEIPPLPGTKTESEEIAGMIKKTGRSCELMSGGSATEKKVKNVENPGIMHIATHGYFVPEKSADTRAATFGIEMEKARENPLLRSGILLAGAAYAFEENSGYGSEADNGILTAYEAMNLRLDHTKLVVLSACETGLGDIKNGEGVYGLQRSFRVAGAENLIMSLHKVNDQASQMLMMTFYKHLLNEGNIANSFREAQREIKSKFEHPYYWAAFILISS